MGIDYYGVLEITRSATPKDIRKAYARISVREHPERKRACDGTKPSQLNQVWFGLAGEAYEVLSQPLLRAAFDQFGEEGLKNGVPSRDPDLFLKPWAYHGDPLKTYKDFFGTASASGPALLGWQNKFRRPDGINGPWFREKPLELPLPLTLEKISKGGQAEVSFQRRELRGASEIEIHEHVLHVDLQPGLATGTRFILPREGHQAPNSIPGDIVLVTEEVPHRTFKREGADLVATFKVSVLEALIGCAVNVPALDGRTIRVRITDVITPQYELRVKGEGLPRCEPSIPEQEDPTRTCFVEKPTLSRETPETLPEETDQGHEDQHQTLKCDNSETMQATQEEKLIQPMSEDLIEPYSTPKTSSSNKESGRKSSLIYETPKSSREYITIPPLYELASRAVKSITNLELFINPEKSGEQTTLIYETPKSSKEYTTSILPLFQLANQAILKPTENNKSSPDTEQIGENPTLIYETPKASEALKVTVQRISELVAQWSNHDKSNDDISDTLPEELNRRATLSSKTPEASMDSTSKLSLSELSTQAVKSSEDLELITTPDLLSEKIAEHLTLIYSNPETSAECSIIPSLSELANQEVMPSEELITTPADILSQEIGEQQDLICETSDAINECKIILTEQVTQEENQDKSCTIPDTLSKEMGVQTTLICENPECKIILPDQVTQEENQSEYPEQYTNPDILSEETGVQSTLIYETPKTSNTLPLSELATQAVKPNEEFESNTTPAETIETPILIYETPKVTEECTTILPPSEITKESVKLNEEIQSISATPSDILSIKKEGSQPTLICETPKMNEENTIIVTEEETEKLSESACNTPLVTREQPTLICAETPKSNNILPLLSELANQVLKSNEKIKSISTTPSDILKGSQPTLVFETPKTKITLPLSEPVTVAVRTNERLKSITDTLSKKTVSQPTLIFKSPEVCTTTTLPLSELANQSVKSSEELESIRATPEEIREQQSCETPEESTAISELITQEENPNEYIEPCNTPDKLPRENQTLICTGNPEACEGCTIVLPPESNIEEPTLPSAESSKPVSPIPSETMSSDSSHVDTREQTHGDLVLRFQVEWPPYVPATRRNALVIALKNLTPNIPQDRAFISPIIPF